MKAGPMKDQVCYTRIVYATKLSIIAYLIENKLGSQSKLFPSVLNHRPSINRLFYDFIFKLVLGTGFVE